jgi:hypothetical protein
MFFATDIASFLACPHRATLTRAELKNEIAKPFRQNAAVDLLRKLGLEHEQRYLRGLSEKDVRRYTRTIVHAVPTIAGGIFAGDSRFGRPASTE